MSIILYWQSCTFYTEKNVFVLTIHLVWFLNVFKKKYAEFVIVVIVFHLISGIFQENLSIVCWKNDPLRLSLRLNYTLGYSNDFPSVHTFYHKRQIQRNRRSIHRMLLLNSIFTKCYYCVHFFTGNHVKGANYHKKYNQPTISHTKYTNGLTV